MEYNGENNRRRAIEIENLFLFYNFTLFHFVRRKCILKDLNKEIYIKSWCAQIKLSNRKPNSIFLFVVFLSLIELNIIAFIESGDKLITIIHTYYKRRRKIN